MLLVSTFDKSTFGFGVVLSSNQSQYEAFHQNSFEGKWDARMPREAMSAGLLTERTSFHNLRGIDESISDDRLPMNTDHFLGEDDSQCSTMDESVQAKIVVSFAGKEILILLVRRVKRTAPHSSSLGSERTLIGASLLFAATKNTDIVLYLG